MPYDAFTIDTNAIIQGGINFEAGLLAQLNQFKDGPVQFVVSEIVVRETLKHVNVSTKKARDAARSALDRAAQLGLISSDAAKTAIDALADSRTVARSKVASFLEATGAETVPANLCAIDALLKSYFDPTPPFEATGDKKNEFPDALALLSLEAWAKAAGKTVLAASADRGWQSFAEKSEHIFVEGDLADAMQIVQAHAEAAAKAVNTFLRGIAEGDLPDDERLMSGLLADALAEWEFDVEASAPYRYELDSTELRLESFELTEREGDHGVTVVRLTADEVVCRVDVEVTATAHAEFSLFAWDSIDREEIGMGGTSASSEETFDAAVLITIAGSIDGQSQTWRSSTSKSWKHSAASTWARSTSTSATATRSMTTTSCNSCWRPRKVTKGRPCSGNRRPDASLTSFYRCTQTTRAVASIAGLSE